MKAIANLIGTIFLFALSNYSFANDSYLGSIGGNPFPQKSSSITMIEEYVTIELNEDGGIVKCKFWFVNNGNSDTVFVGFPNFFADPIATSEPLMSFKTWINGNATSVNEEDVIDTIGTEEIIKNWYYWKTFFPKGDTVLIENSYIGRWARTVCERGFSYTIGTGNKWNGPIGKGKIVFKYGNLFSDFFIDKNYEKENKSILKTYYEDSLVYSFINYVPSENESLNIWASAYWIDFDEECDDCYKCPGLYIPREYLQKNKNEIIDELLARYGNIFEDTEKQAKYTKKNWYKPTKKISIDELPISAKRYITNLLQEKSN